MWQIRGNRGWVALALLGLLGCRVGERPLEPENPKTGTQQLTFQALNLQQVNPNGQILWKLQAQQAVADPQTRRVQVQKLVGDIYDQGKPRYRVETAQAAVQAQEETLTIQGDIRARDLQTKTQITTQALLWRPQAQELLLQGNLRLQHPNLEAKAQAATIWLRHHQVALRQKVHVTYRQPALQITGEALDWQWQRGQVQAPQRVHIRYVPQQWVVQAGQGILDVPNQVLQLSQGVQAVAPQGQLRAQQVEWHIAAQQVIAIGQVVYRHYDPPLTVTGNRAEGHLATRQLRVYQASTQLVP